MADGGADLIFALSARIDKLERALARAEAISAAAGKKIETHFRDTNKKISDGLTQSATGFARLGQVTGAQRFVIQNTANQFGDLAVQIASGTTVMRAMSQQAPQLLGGLGALGGTLGTLGPLMGTVAAIGLPLAAVFFNMATGAEEAASRAETLDEKIDGLAKSVSDYRAAADLSLQSTADLREEYGAFADEIQRALDVQEKLKRGAAERGVADTAKAVSGVYGTLDGFDAGGSAKVAAQQRKILLNELQDELNVTEAQARKVADALVALGNAHGVDAQVASLRSLEDVFIGIFGSIEAADGATGGLVSRINEAVIEGEKLRAKTAEVAEASSLIAGGIDAASAAMTNAQSIAAGLAGTIRDAASAAWELAKARAQAEANLQAEAFGNSPGGQALQVYGGRTPGGTAAQNALATRNAPVAVRSRGGGGGGGGRSINAQEAADLAKVKALYASTRTELERYNEERADLNRLLKEGRIDQELFDRALKNLDESLPVQRLDNFKEGILDLATGVRTAEDAFDALKQAIIRAVAEYAFFGSGPLSGGGGIGGAISGLLGSIFSFDGGGYTGPGVRAGGLDGKGGRLAMVHPRETVIDHTKGGGVTGTVHLVVEASEDLRVAARSAGASAAVTVVNVANKRMTEAQRRR